MAEGTRVGVQRPDTGLGKDTIVAARDGKVAIVLAGAIQFKMLPSDALALASAITRAAELILSKSEEKSGEG